MAEFKKAIEKTLKPFAKKVGSDIKNIESKIFTGKVINVVEFGVDNTGATDASVKLNELFQKVYNENYTEVIFPDGTYRLDNRVNIKIPSDHKKYINIHAQNEYKAVFELHGTRDNEADGSIKQIGFQLSPENFESTTTHGYNVRFDGFVFNSHELPTGEFATPSQSIYCIFTNQNADNGFDIGSYKLYNLTCTNLEFNGGTTPISIGTGLFNSEFKNIKINDSYYCIDLNGSLSNNNKVENITIRNCKNGTNISSNVSAKNIDIIQDDESIIPLLGSAYIITGYDISNISYKGYYNMLIKSEVLTLNCATGCNISNIIFDLKPVNTELELYIGEGIVPYLITINPKDSEPSIINLSNISFETFEEKFADLFSKVELFAYFNTSSPVSIHNIAETTHLKYFNEKGTNFIYDKTGSMTESYNTKNKSFISRPYLGTDRNIIGTADSENNKFAALYLASSEGSPVSGKGKDYSENTAGIKGDIFTELSPEKNGHFAYVSTYINTKDTVVYRRDMPITSFTYNAGDKTYTATFTELPKFKNGSMKDKTVNVGSIIENLDSGELDFEITAVDENAKTLTLKPSRETMPGYANPYTINRITDLAGEDPIFLNGYRLKPRKINRMKNMTYVTVPIIHSGTTENRPTEHIVVGQMYFDTTIGAPVFWNGTEWIQGNNSSSVDTSNLVTKEELNTTLNAINEKLKQIRGE